MNLEPSQYIGYKWMLLSVEFIVGAPTSTSESRASIEFGADGTLVAFDAVNTLSGGYVVSSTGIKLFRPGSTFVGYRGHDAGILAARKGIGLMFPLLDDAAQTAGPCLELQIEDAQLVIFCGGCVLRFGRESANSGTRPNRIGRPGPLPRT